MTGPELRKSSSSRNATPGPGTPARSTSISRAATPIRGTPVKFSIPTGLFNKRDTLLQCALCQRRIGLWTFLAQTSTTTKSGSDAHLDSSAPSTPRRTVQQRQFDLLREHRSYCPYVVRSTSIPALPIPPTFGSSSSGTLKVTQSGQDNVLEGWRAVLTVVLRYGLCQKQTLERDVFATEGETSQDSTEAMEIDGVRAMVTGVKSRGVSFVFLSNSS